MQIPSNRLDRLFAMHQSEYEAKAVEVLRSGYYIMGREAERFEKEFAAFLGGGHVVGVGCGLDAIRIALHLLGVGPGDEVIIQGNTFIAAVLAIWAPGAVRLFSPDAEVIRWGAVFIRVNVFFLLFNCVNHVLAGALRGRGDSRGPMIIMLSTFVVLRQIYLYAVTHFVANTPALVGFGYPVGWMSCCVVELLYARYRLRRRTDEELLNGSEEF